MENSNNKDSKLWVLTIEQDKLLKVLNLIDKNKSKISFFSVSNDFFVGGYSYFEIFIKFFEITFKKDLKNFYNFGSLEPIICDDYKISRYIARNL